MVGITNSAPSFIPLGHHSERQRTPADAGLFDHDSDLDSSSSGMILMAVDRRSIA